MTPVKAQLDVGVGGQGAGHAATERRFEPADTVLTEVAKTCSNAEVWWTLAWGDIKSRYRRTILGPFWLTLNVAAMVVGLGVLFAGLFQNDVARYLPFLAVGFPIWGFIASTIQEGCNIFVSSAGLIKSSTMPLTIHVFRMIARNLIIFLHNILVVVPVWLYFQWPLDLSSLSLLIPALAVLLIFLFGMTLACGIICTRFHDISQIVSAVLQLLFLVTPIMWLPESLRVNRFIIDSNPLFYLVDIVRAPLLGQLPTGSEWLIAMGCALISATCGLWIYAKFRYRVAYWL